MSQTKDSREQIVQSVALYGVGGHWIQLTQTENERRELPSEKTDLVRPGAPSSVLAPNAKAEHVLLRSFLRLPGSPGLPSVLPSLNFTCVTLFVLLISVF